MKYTALVLLAFTIGFTAGHFFGWWGVISIPVNYMLGWYWNDIWAFITKRRWIVIKTIK